MAEPHLIIYIKSKENIVKTSVYSNIILACRNGRNELFFREIAYAQVEINTEIPVYDNV